MKILHFRHFGNYYQVNLKGHIKANGLSYFSKDWVFLGGSRHHWSNHIDVSLRDAFKDPSLLNNTLGWDLDHGTIRRWGGQYCGKVPRINNAYVKEENHV